MKWFDKIMQWLGWRFDPEKNQDPVAVLPLVGNLEDYGNCGVREALTIDPKPERVKEILEDLALVRLRRHCPYGGGCLPQRQALAYFISYAWPHGQGYIACTGGHR